MWGRAGASTNPPVGVKSRKVAGNSGGGESGRGLKRGEWRGDEYDEGSGEDWRRRGWGRGAIDGKKLG